MIVILIIIGVIFLAIMSMGSSTVTATGTATGTVKGTGTSTETASEPPAPKKMATTYSLYSKKPFWDSNRDKIDCENARGRDIKGNNGDYANYCIFTGADAEVNAQNACTSSDECVGYVGVEGSKDMFQLTSMPKADSDATSTRRFYVRTPLPPSQKNIVLPVAGFINQRPSLAYNPGYHSDIQALGGHPHMNLV
jgi:hypothetical protein